MAKFSLVGDEEDGEGPSDARRKRQRTSFASASASTSTSNGVGITFEENQPPPQPLPLTVDQHEQEEEAESEEEEEEEEQQQLEEEEGAYGEQEAEERDPEEEIEEIDQVPFSTLRVVTRSRSSSKSIGLSSAADQEGSISVKLTDPDVLDCSICYEPLAIPVFQCENGHVACSSCCGKIEHKCPSCSWPIGYNRCRAIEKVLEAVRISCSNTKYGCKELVRYSDKKSHESTCIHSPCSCPHPGCNVVSSAGNLYQHFRCKHLDCAVRFQYNRTFNVALDANERFQILQEQDEGVIFLLNNSSELLGNLLTVSCIWNRSFSGFFYDIVAKSQGNSLRLQSFTECTKRRSNSILVTTGFLLVPQNFRNSSNELKLELCIWSKDSFPTNF
ncbi:E3 ubiquitin-protein ligase SINA-like 10 isoform X2 [Ziziphus jujuba]|uniref:RING-type E3 ubiquitin transferase n=1 Tax=Ziziphus jujuba TaxID=326968 RepID=A0ABM3IGC7_ZIZJJ|nr:E3 ubiquitin-protein ligase SINA-like 10 isoform X2 [Ziziphus jujuba]